jgi:hypothetical protein
LYLCFFKLKNLDFLVMHKSFQIKRLFKIKILLQKYRHARFIISVSCNTWSNTFVVIKKQTIQ